VLYVEEMAARESVVRVAGWLAGMTSIKLPDALLV
jgi:hypothetical protein